MLIVAGVLIWLTTAYKSDHPSSSQVTRTSAPMTEEKPPTEHNSASDDPTECWFRRKTRVETDMNLSWLPNEERTCLIYSDDTDKAQLVNCSTGGDKTHNIPVGFCGDVTEKVSEWKCRRDGDEFVCGAISRTIWGTDKATGRRVVSHDGGKTWQWAFGNGVTGEINLDQPK